MSKKDPVPTQTLSIEGVAGSSSKPYCNKIFRGLRLVPLCLMLLYFVIGVKPMRICILEFTWNFDQQFLTKLPDYILANVIGDKDFVDLKKT